MLLSLKFLHELSVLLFPGSWFSFKAEAFIGGTVKRDYS